MDAETVAALTGALAGAIVGGGIGFLGTLLRDKLATENRRQRLAAALTAELSENKVRFSEFAAHLKQLESGQPLELLFTRWSGQNFFPVYDNSTRDLGLFKPEDAIAVTHATNQFKSLIEHFNMMHDREARFSQLINQIGLTGHGVSSLEQRRRDLHIEDVRRLRPALNQLLEDVEKTISVLQKYEKRHRKRSLSS